MIAFVIVDSGLRSDGFDLLPLIQTRADLNKLNEISHLSNPMTLPYVSFLLSASKLARRLNVTVASGAIPPFAVNTRGAKEAC